MSGAPQLVPRTQRLHNAHFKSFVSDQLQCVPMMERDWEVKCCKYTLGVSLLAWCSLKGIQFALSGLPHNVDQHGHDRPRLPVPWLHSESKLLSQTKMLTWQWRITLWLWLQSIASTADHYGINQRFFEELKKKKPQITTLILAKHKKEN